MADFKSASDVAAKVGRLVKRPTVPEWYLGIGVDGGKAKSFSVSVRVQRGHVGVARRLLGVQRGPIRIDGVTVHIVVDKLARPLPRAARKDAMSDPFPHLTRLSELANAPSPYATMTDKQIAAELKRLQHQFDRVRDDEVGHGGSPGEWIVEEMSGLETEQKRRKGAEDRWNQWKQTTRWPMTRSSVWTAGAPSSETPT